MSETFTNITAGSSWPSSSSSCCFGTNFQSLRLAFAVVSTVPAVLAGVVTMFRLTGTTLNVQSSAVAIMAIGVAVANAILLCDVRRAGITAAAVRHSIPAIHAARAHASGADDERRDDRRHGSRWPSRWARAPRRPRL